jgi:sarcosine oxidase subunit gamma
VVERRDLALVQLSATRTGLALTRERFRTAFGLDLPAGPMRTSHGDLTALGLAPGRWLIVGSGSGEELGARLASAVEAAGLATDQSDARAVFRVAGAYRRAMLETLLPIDLHPRAFPENSVAVTEMALMPVIVWSDGPEAVFLAVPRSLEADTARLLDDAVKASGAQDRFM